MNLALRIEELERRCEEYRVLDETSDAVPFRLAADLSRLIYVGPQAGRLLGIVHAHWLEPRFFEQRLAADDLAKTFEQFRLVLEFEASHEAEFRLRRDDGNWIWIRCTMRTFASASGTVLAGHMLDISVRRRLESDDAQLQRLEAVGRLASGIAHEINTPLQFIGHSLEFLGEAFEDLVQVARHGAPAPNLAELETDTTQALAYCNEGIARVSALVKSMRSFVHVPGKEKALASVNDTVRTAITICMSEHKAVAEVVTEFADLPPIPCHASELGQVFVNLIVNAAQAIEEVMRASRRRGTITISTHRDHADVVIGIADTGGGIPEHVRGRVFDPFFTTKEVGRGTGQGLAISRAVVERHGGTLSFETELGRGTTFIVRLPT